MKVTFIDKYKVESEVSDGLQRGAFQGISGRS